MFRKVIHNAYDFVIFQESPTPMKPSQDFEGVYFSNPGCFPVPSFIYTEPVINE
jgi:hypothetical protein